MVIKRALMAPNWTRIGPSYIVFCGESDDNIPAAQFGAKTRATENDARDDKRKQRKQQQT